MGIGRHQTGGIKNAGISRRRATAHRRLFVVISGCYLFHVARVIQHIFHAGIITEDTKYPQVKDQSFFHSKQFFIWKVLELPHKIFQ
jgi:hypothetical protein